MDLQRKSPELGSGLFAVLCFVKFRACEENIAAIEASGRYPLDDGHRSRETSGTRSSMRCKLSGRARVFQQRRAVFFPLSFELFLNSFETCYARSDHFPLTIEALVLFHHGLPF
jgi:hypothetical protein